jgi:hypothetical protein
MTDPTPIHTATVRAWVADHVDRAFADLRTFVGMVNPLLPPGTYCGGCGLRLNTGDVDSLVALPADCPMCCEGAA